LGLFDKLVSLAGYIKRGLAFIVKPFVRALKLITKFVILIFYRLYLFLKKKFQVFYLPAKNRIFSFFSKKYLIHFAIIIISFLVVVNSINAQEIREDNFGEKTIIYSMYNEQTLGYIEEEVTRSSGQAKILSYLDKSSVSAQPSVVSNEKVEVPKNQLADSLTAVTQGGAALVKPNITETRIAEQPREEVMKYAVQKNDTLSGIAEKFNITVNTLLWANDLSESSIINPGDSLTILPVSGVLHKVKSGETLSKLAIKYDVKEDKIIEYNKLADAGDIQVDQNLIIPGGTMPRTITTSRSYVSNKRSVNIAPIKSLITAPPSAPSVPAGKMVWPTSGHRITQYYSWRHHGLDVDGDYSSPIYASEAGTVVKAGWGTGYGNVIYINHGGGVQTRYAHLSKFFVSNGQQVSKGQTLGMMGTTGWSTGTHLHFEVRINGSPLNPLSYIR